MFECYVVEVPADGEPDILNLGAVHTFPAQPQRGDYVRCPKLSGTVLGFEYTGYPSEMDALDPPVMYISAQVKPDH